MYKSINYKSRKITDYKCRGISTLIGIGLSASKYSGKTDLSQISRQFCRKTILDIR